MLTEGIQFSGPDLPLCKRLRPQLLITLGRYSLSLLEVLVCKQSINDFTFAQDPDLSFFTSSLYIYLPSLLSFSLKSFSSFISFCIVSGWFICTAFILSSSSFGLYFVNAELGSVTNGKYS